MTGKRAIEIKMREENLSAPDKLTHTNHVQRKKNASNPTFELRLFYFE